VLQADDALSISVSGGYGMFIDTLGESQEEADARDILLCKTCAELLCRTSPYFLDAVESHISGSVGHQCVDGELVWEPIDQCSTDSDLHGWRRVWLAVEQTAGDQGLNRLRDRVVHGVFDSYEEAEAWCGEHGGDLSVIETLSGNLGVYYGVDGRRLDSGSDNDSDVSDGRRERRVGAVGDESLVLASVTLELEALCERLEAMGEHSSADAILEADEAIVAIQRVLARSRVNLAQAMSVLERAGLSS
jgi:hypothetical protein